MSKISVEEGIVSHWRYMRHVAGRFTNKHHQDTEDLVSHAMMTALSRVKSWENHKNSFFHWIKYIIYESARTYQLGNVKTQDANSFGSVSVNSDDYVDTYSVSIDDQMMLDTLNKLPYPDVARMTYAGFTYSEIGKQINRSQHAVLNRILKNKAYLEVLMQ